jgi:hypothetical protein
VSERYVNRYGQPPYKKAHKKLRKYIDFWFKLGMSSLVGGSIAGFILFIVGAAVRNAVVAVLGAGLIAASFLFAEICRKKWQDGYAHVFHAIDVISKILTRKHNEKYAFLKERQ